MPSSLRPPRKSVPPSPAARLLLPALLALGATLPAHRANASDAADPNATEPRPPEPRPPEPATTEQGTDEAALVEAQLHFANGVELLQSSPPNYQDAFPQFLAAYAKSGRSWKVLGNLGLCALKLERDGEALTYYRRYLDEGGDEVDPDERADIERELLLVEGNLAHLQLRASEPNVRITVSRQGSSAPPQVYQLTEGQPLGLRAGAHTVTAEAGGKTRTWEGVLSPGQTAEHFFDFTEAPVAGAPLAPATTSTAASDSGVSPLRLTGFVTAGVGVAALLGGGVTGFLTKQREDDARDQCAGNVCPTAVRSDFDSAESLATLTNVLLIGGGVLAVTGVTLILLGGDSKAENPTAARVQLTPSALPQGGGLWATGTF